MNLGYVRYYGIEDGMGQLEAVQSAGADRLYIDRQVPASAVGKTQYHQALRALKRGDALVIWRLDRLSSTYSTLLLELKLLDRLGVDLVSLCDGIDTRVDRTFFTHMRALMAFGDQAAIGREESRRIVVRDDLPERRKCGQPPVISAAKWEDASARLAAKEATVTSIAAELGVSRQAIYKRLGTSASA